MAKLKAYLVTDLSSWESDSVVIFAYKNVVARREGAAELNTIFPYVSCRRLPWADEYGSYEKIPKTVLLENGWHFFCPYCETEIWESTHFFIDQNNEIFCSESCCKKHSTIF